MCLVQWAKKKINKKLKKWREWEKREISAYRKETSGYIQILIKSCTHLCNHFPPYFSAAGPPHGIWELIDARSCKCRELRKKKAVGNGARRIDLELHEAGKDGHFLNHFFNLNHNFLNRNTSVQWSCQPVHRHKGKTAKQVLYSICFMFFFYSDHHTSHLYLLTSKFLSVSLQCMFL